MLHVATTTIERCCFCDETRGKLFTNNLNDDSLSDNVMYYVEKEKLSMSQMIE